MSQTLLTMADYLDVSTFAEAAKEEIAKEEIAKEEIAKVKEMAADQDAVELNNEGDAFGNDDDHAIIMEEAKL